MCAASDSEEMWLRKVEKFREEAEEAYEVRQAKAEEVGDAEIEGAEAENERHADEVRDGLMFAFLGSDNPRYVETDDMAKLYFVLTGKRLR